MDLSLLSIIPDVEDRKIVERVSKAFEQERGAEPQKVPSRAPSPKTPIALPPKAPPSKKRIKEPSKVRLVDDLPPPIVDEPQNMHMMLKKLLDKH